MDLVSESAFKFCGSTDILIFHGLLVFVEFMGQWSSSFEVVEIYLTSKKLYLDTF